MERVDGEKTGDPCDRKKQSIILLGRDLDRTKKAVGILRDVSRCIDDYRWSGSDRSFRGHIPTGLTSSRSNFYGIPGGSFTYHVQPFSASDVRYLTRIQSDELYE